MAEQDDGLTKKYTIDSDALHPKQKYIPVTNVHTNIVDLMQILGYDIDDGGVCFGFACMAAQASLLGQSGLREFYERLRYIDKLCMSPEFDLENILKKNIHNLRAFFDGVFLYQSYRKDNKILGVIDQRHQMQIDRVSDVFNLVKPHSLVQKQLSINQQDAYCGCFDQTTLTNFLNEVDNHLKSLDESALPIIMHVGSLDHATAIVYFPDQKVYSFFNANDLLSNGQTQFTSLKDMQQYLWRAFDFRKDSLRKQKEDTLALSIAIFTTDKSPQDKWLSNISITLGVDQLNDSSINNSTLLMLAAQNGHIEVIKKLLAIKGLDINKSTNQGFTALMLATQNGHIEVVRKLLEIEGIDINKSMDDGFTVLMMAAQKGYSEVVTTLLKVESIDINKKTDDNFTVLMLAAQNGHIRVVEELLKIDILDINHKNIKGFTALMLAAYGGHAEVVKKLLEDKKIDINIKNNSGRTAFEIAVEQGHASVVELLLEKTNNQQLNNALILAVQKGHINIVEILLKKMDQISNVDIRTSNYNEALLFAALNGHVDIVKILIEKGANNFEDALTVAVKKLQMQVVNFLLTTTSFDDKFVEKIIKILLSTSSQQDQDANTILYLAAKNGHTGIVNLLLNSTQTKIDVNSKNGKGETALMWASLEGHIDIVKKLLAHQNIDPNIKSNKGYSALVLAVMQSHFAVVKALLPTANLDILQEALKCAKKTQSSNKKILKLIKNSIAQRTASLPSSLSASGGNPTSALPDVYTTLKQKTRLPLGTLQADTLTPAAPSSTLPSLKKTKKSK